MAISAALALASGSAGCGPRSLGSFHFAEADASPESAEDAQQDAGVVAPPAADADVAEQEPDAGPSETPECLHSSDCDDADPCNGVYDCVSGHCREQVAPCVTPDPQHCEAHCAREDGGACVILARDSDGDGHGDQACTAALEPAKDCDDGDPAVHPGVLELCDGVDNDCNGVADLQDGFTLAGINKRVALGMLPVSASSPEGTFGAAYAMGGGHVAFHSFTLSGDDYFGQMIVAHLDPYSMQVVPALAAGNDAFGLTWSRNGTVRFLQLDREGVALNRDAVSEQSKADVNPVEVPAGWASTASLEDGDWLVLYAADEPAQLFARRVTALNVLSEPWPVAGGRLDALPQLVRSEHGVAGVWTSHLGSEQQIELALRLDDPDGLTVRHLASSNGLKAVSSPVLAVRDGAHGVAWSESTNFAGGVALRFVELDGEGNERCAAFDLDLPHTDGSSALVPTAMVATERGYLIAGYTASATGTSVELLEVAAGDHGCHYVQRARVAEKSSRNVTLTRAATGELLVLWDAADAGSQPFIFKRAIAAPLCAEPDPAP